MHSAPPIVPVSKKLLWLGRVLSALTVLFLTFDAIIHIMNLPVVVEAFTTLGYNPNVALTLGVIESICILLYIVPQTSFWGAIFLTGYLGGAVASHVRIEDPLFSTVLFPIYVAVFLWAGLSLRNDRVRAALLCK